MQVVVLKQYLAFILDVCVAHLLGPWTPHMVVHRELAMVSTFIISHFTCTAGFWPTLAALPSVKVEVDQNHTLVPSRIARSQPLTKPPG